MADEKPDGKTLESSEKSRPKFRLRFSQGLELGRSQFSVPRLPESIVTSKFYCTNDLSELEEDEKVMLIMDEISKSRRLGPREKYEEPVLESQRYGWFQEKFIDSFAETERVNFPKRTSEMVKIQNLLDNAAKAEQFYLKAKSTK